MAKKLQKVHDTSKRQDEEVCLSKKILSVLVMPSDCYNFFKKNLVSFYKKKKTVVPELMM